MGSFDPAGFKSKLTVKQRTKIKLLDSAKHNSFSLTMNDT